MSLKVSLDVAVPRPPPKKPLSLKTSGNESSSADSGKPHPDKILVEENGHLTRTMNRKVDFQVDHDSQELIVQVINAKTGEIVVQIPRDDFSLVKNRPAPSPGDFFNEFA